MILGILFHLMVKNNLKDIRREFRTSAFQHIHLLNKDVEILRQFVRDAQFFFSASEEVTEEEFQYFVNYILGKGKILAAWIPAGQQEAPLIPAFMAYTYIDSRMAEAIFKSEDVQKALLKADSDTPLTTSCAFPFTVLEQDGEEPLIALVAPTHSYLWPGKEWPKGGKTGSLLIVVRANTIVTAPREVESPAREKLYAYLIGKDGRRETLLQPEGEEEPVAMATRIVKTLFRSFSFDESVRVPIGTREFELNFAPHDSLWGEALNGPVWTFLFMGIILTSAIAIALQMVINRQEQVQKLADLKTAELSLSEARQKAILKNIADGVLTMDKTGTINMFNLACEKMFGFFEYEVIGRSIKDYIPGLRHAGDEIGPECLGVVRESTGMHRDQTLFPLEISVGSIPEDPKNQFVGVVRDITLRKQDEEKLRKSNQALDDFVYIVSHDLKEPLRCIQNFSSFLLEDCEESLNDECLDYLQTMIRVARRMQDQIDSLLKFSRAGHKEFKTDNVDLEVVVEEVKDSLQRLIKESGAEIVAKDLPIVRYDRSCMVEIIMNLMQNALKYKKDDVTPVVEISARPGETPDIIVLCVKDNGIGIKRENLDVIFKMFKRLHGADQYGGGTGSGLPIVKKLIERHGGTIWAESEYGEGSTFCFTVQNSRPA